MRDSQSLLEQLLSFSGDQVTVEVVHAMLGTADETRLASFATRLIERDAAGALRELNTAADEGVDVGQLAEQLLGYLRDMMTLAVGGSADLVRTANPNSVDQLKEWGKTWGTMTLLSALQLLDETIVKMRYSVQSRILLEVALVQICNLQDLQALSDLVKAFSTQSAPPPRIAARLAPLVSLPIESKKKVELKPTPERSEPEVVTPAPCTSKPVDPPELIISIDTENVIVAEVVQTIELQPIVLPHKPTIAHAQVIRNAMVHPLIKQFMDIFEAQVVRVDAAQIPIPAPQLDLKKPNAPESEDISLREKLRMEVRFESAIDE